MKRCKKIISAVLSVLVCFACVLCSAPITRAAGLMRLIIDDITYSKIYTDTGSLLLSHWFYDASEDVLQLEDFGTASSPKSSIFAYPYSGSMTIELKGNNYITAPDDSALTIIGNVNFTGSGSLTITCPNTYCMYTEYAVTVSDGATLNLNGIAGITANKGFTFDTTGSVNITSVTKCLYTAGDISVKSGDINLRGSIGAYTSKGNVYLSGGPTDVEIISTTRAIYIVGTDSYVEWSANAVINAGETAPGSTVTKYNNEKYFHASFSGLPKLNYPRSIYWDSTVIDEGVTNPVGRWSAVANATGYVVNLYYYNNSYYTLMESFTVTDALSCNFGGHFTTYGQYYFTVTTLGDGINFITGNESPKSSNYYRFSGDVESRYYVTLPESEYFEVVPVSGSTVVYYGDSYSFTIDVDPAYTQSEILVWANKSRIALRHGLYTIDNVTENITITVGELSMNTYTVNLPTSEAYTLYPLPDYSTNVAYGGSFAFSIELSDIYLQSNPVITANGVELIPKYGIIYTVSNITADQNIEITGLVRDNYDVTFKQLDGTVISTQTVDHGYAATVPNNPAALDGMTFAGWYNADGSVYNFATPVTEHKTVYARYTAPQDSDGYYLISTLDQLIWFRDEVNYGNRNINARLCNDLTMNSGNYVMVGNEAVFSETAVMWKPIGCYDYTDTENYVRFFNGHFDGGGHTLKGFYAKYDAMSADASYLGIFGAVDEDGSITNLNVTRSYFDGYSYIGSIAGRCLGAINGCNASASCSGVESVGGIAGSAAKAISNCTNSGSVTVEQYTSAVEVVPIGGKYGGGIVGRVETGDVTISGCMNSGTVTAYDCAGGIAGYADSFVNVKQAGTEEQPEIVYDMIFISCENSAPVSGSSYSGGICGRGGTQFTTCANSGAVSGDTAAGGIVGQTKSAVYTDVSNSGSVISLAQAGGISGIGTLINSMRVFNTANINGGSYAGGITGKGNISVSYCFNSGDLSATSFAGGFAGESAEMLLRQCHSFGNATAAKTDAFSAAFLEVSATQTFYCKERFSSAACGTGALYDWFYSGYLAFVLNRLNETSFWAQGSFYPEFATNSKPAYVLPFSGSSSLSEPYLIANERELRLLSALVNNETGYDDGYYSLTADIYLHNAQSVNNFVPIGSADKHFRGLFEGNSHTISGVNIYSYGDNVGLFSYIEDGMVENLTLDSFVISGGTNVGAVVGYSSGGFINYITLNNSSVSGYENVGGIIGRQTGDSYRCFSSATVSGTISVGGIVGLNEDNSVMNCFNYGSVTGVSHESVQPTEAGGVAGKSFGTMLDCGNSGAVSSVSFAGGVVGINYGYMSALFNSGMITSAENYGGICADNQSENEPDSCFYLEGSVSDGGYSAGTPQTVIQITNGTTAYYLNFDGQSVSWKQGSSYPELANENGDYAVIYAVTFISFEKEYYFAATYADGSITPPIQPTASGYNFLRWDRSLINVNETATTYAVFDRAAYITFTPTATINSIDYDTGSIIVGINPDERMTASDLRNMIANEKIVISDADGVNELDAADYIYTGTTVQLYEEVGIYYHSAWVVIYGDINGDGIVDGYDAFLLNAILSQMLSTDDLSYAQRLAADIDGDGNITQADANQMENYCVKNATITQLRNSDV